MKKVLALVLAAVMMLTLGVGALADEGVFIASQPGTRSILGDAGGNGDKGFMLTPEVLDVSKIYTLDEIYLYNGNEYQSLEVGSERQLYLYYVELENEANWTYHIPAYHGDATWESSAPEIATVSETGLVKGVSTTGWERGVAPVEIYVTIPQSAGKLDEDDTDLQAFRIVEKDAEVYNDSVKLVLADDPTVTSLEVTNGATIKLGAFFTDTNEPYPGEIRWEGSQNGITVSDDGTVEINLTNFNRNADGSFNSEGTGAYSIRGITARAPATKSELTTTFYLTIMRSADDPTPSDPTTPTNPTDPTRPSVADSGSREDKAPEATQNAANDDKTTDALRKGEAVEVKVSNGSSALSTETANLLGGGSGKLTLQNGGMTVVLPGGFGKVTEAGRVYYPFDFEQNPARAAEILSGVKGDGARSEAVKAGGVMTLPVSATVTLRTKLTGTVNVYWYNEDTKRYTLVASPAVTENGTITFPTRQMGYFLLTTGRV